MPVQWLLMCRVTMSSVAMVLSEWKWGVFAFLTDRLQQFTTFQYQGMLFLSHESPFETETKWQSICRRHDQVDFLVRELCFLLQFYWNTYPNAPLIINQHSFRWWPAIEQAASHYLSQYCPSLVIHICVTQPRWVRPHQATYLGK